MMEILIAKNFYRSCGVFLVILSLFACITLVDTIRVPSADSFKMVNGTIDEVELVNNQIYMFIDGVKFTYSKWNGGVSDLFSHIKPHIGDLAELLVYYDESGSAQVYSIYIDSESFMTLNSIVEHRDRLLKSVIIISILFCSLGLIGIFCGGWLVEMNRKFT